MNPTNKKALPNAGSTSYNTPTVFSSDVVGVMRPLIKRNKYFIYIDWPKFYHNYLQFGPAVITATNGLINDIGCVNDYERIGKNMTKVAWINTNSYSYYNIAYEKEGVSVTLCGFSAFSHHIIEVDIEHLIEFVNGKLPCHGFDPEEFFHDWHLICQTTSKEKRTPLMEKWHFKYKTGIFTMIRWQSIMSKRRSWGWK